MSFDTNGKLLTGRKPEAGSGVLLNNKSRQGFFNSGKAKASFQSSGKCPDCSEVLMMFVKNLTFAYQCGWHGSRGQDLRAEFWMSSLTSLSDSIVKVGNDGADSASAAHRVSYTRCESAGLVSSCLRIVSIFFTKCFPKSLYCPGAAGDHHPPRG